MTTATAQTSKKDPTDSQGWLGAKLNFDLPKGWATSAEYQTRFINDLNTYNGSYISLGGEKKLAKFFTAEAGVRLALVEKGTYLRYSIGGEFNKKVSDAEFKLRLLAQNQSQDFIEPDKASEQSFSWRARFLTSLKLSDELSIFGSTEPVMKVGGAHFVDNWRNTFGLKFKLTKSTKFDLYYIYRPDYGKATYNRYFNIFGFDLNHTIKIKKGKKK